MLKELIQLANELDGRGLVKEADVLDDIIKKADQDVGSHNKITIIKISLLSMGIKELLGFMGLVGGAFGLGRFSGWFKRTWNKLTGAEKEDAADHSSVHDLLDALSAEELEELAGLIEANKEIEETLQAVDEKSLMLDGASPQAQERLSLALMNVAEQFAGSREQPLLEGGIIGETSDV